MSIFSNLALDRTRQGARPHWQGAAVLSVLAALLVTAGCSTQRLAQPAPVEDRSSTRTEVKSLPGAENAGKPGYYTVRPGDTLFRIALDSGQPWRDVQTWNNLSNPNVLEVGQVLRVVPPAGAATTTGATPAGGTTRSTWPTSSTLGLLRLFQVCTSRQG
jgi:lipoprotein NlpD